MLRATLTLPWACARRYAAVMVQAVVARNFRRVSIRPLDSLFLNLQYLRFSVKKEKSLTANCSHSPGARANRKSFRDRILFGGSDSRSAISSYPAVSFLRASANFGGKRHVRVHQDCFGGWRCSASECGAAS